MNHPTSHTTRPRPLAAARASAGTPDDARRVAVIGGGLAGITAALGCADAGLAVTLLEARPRLGGLTHSFRREDLWIDNGQHVFLRCCTSYLRLLDRLGVRDLVRLQSRLDVPVRSERHPGTGRITRTGLPAPLHLARSLLGYRWLAPADRLRVARAALALGRVDRDDPATDRRCFGEWLTAHGQSPRAVEALWDLIGIATLNAPADRASLALAATVFQLGLLDRPDAADIGWAAVPLQRLHGDPAARALATAGATVRTDARVVALESGDPADGTGRWRVRVREAGSESGGDPGTDTYDDVVLAVPPDRAEQLLPTGAVGAAPGWAQQLGSTPIVNVHVLLDRRALPEPFTAAVDSPLQWVFDRTASAGLDPAGRDGQLLALSLSAADDLVGRPVAELRDWLLPHLTRLLPAAADAHVKEFLVTREPHATFRSAPGSGRHRAATRTALPGLHLAGAWTATGWPATMEGAVRSGEAATAAVLDDAATARPIARPIGIVSTTRPTIEPAPAPAPVAVPGPAGPRHRAAPDPDELCAPVGAPARPEPADAAGRAARPAHRAVAEEPR